MAAPTGTASNLSASIIISNGVRLNFTAGNGEKRLVAVTERGATPTYPVNGVKYSADIHFGRGDPLVATISGSGSCYPYPYPDPDPETLTDEQKGATTSTYVVYDGTNDGTTGIDIINLAPQSSYTIQVFEHNSYCYSPSETFSVKTGFVVNASMVGVEVLDNRTRCPIGNVSVAFRATNTFIGEIDNTESDGRLTTIPLEEGRYEASFVAQGYDSKVLTGIFIQRLEPHRDNFYREWENGQTYIGGATNRQWRENKNQYFVYLDPSGTTNQSYTKYNPRTNPSNLTKM